MYLILVTDFIIGIVVLLIVQAYCELMLPRYMSQIVDVGIMQGLIVGEPGYMQQMMLTMILFTVIACASVVIVSLLASLTAAGVGRKLRRDVFTQIMDYSSAELEKFARNVLIDGDFGHRDDLHVFKSLRDGGTDSEIKSLRCEIVFWYMFFGFA